MIKVLTAALLGTVAGIIVMVVVIAISGTDTSNASSEGLGSLPISTFTPSTPTSSSGGSSTPTSGGSSGGSSSGGVTGDVAAGKATFTSAGCSGCHTLAAAGATGAVGPNLDTSLAESAGSTPLPEFIKESIIDPDKVIASGFSAGIMPTNFGTSLSSTDIDNLVALIMSDQK